MLVSIDELQKYHYNEYKLFGQPEDPTTWYWAREKQYEESEMLGSALEILWCSTPYETLEWEMENHEDEEEYEAEYEEKERWEMEVYDVMHPSFCNAHYRNIRRWKNIISNHKGEEA
jgi:hypothetical protein